MLRYPTAILALLAMCPLPCMAQAGPSWQGLRGGAYDSWDAKGSGQVAMILDASGYPIVAWSDDRSGIPQIRLLRWSPAGWTGMGGSDGPQGLSASADACADPSLDVDLQGNIAIAWVETRGTMKRIQVRRFNPPPAAPQWLPVGDTAASGVYSSPFASAPRILIAQLVLDVAWTEALPAGSQAYALHWAYNATAWTEVDGSASGKGVSKSPGSAIQPCLGPGPSLAWIDVNASVRSVYLKVLPHAATAWLESSPGSASGSGIAGGADCSNPVIAMSSNPLVKHIAWSQTVDGIRQILMKRLESQGWQGLGNSAVEGLSGSLLGADHPSIAFRQQSPIIAWRDGAGATGDVHLRQWNQQRGAWEELEGSATGGGISMSGGVLAGPVVGGDRFGCPVVSWIDASQAGTRRVVVGHLEPVWGQLDGSGLGGVSRTPVTDSCAPCMALDASGNPVLAWSETGPTGKGEIYVMRWDGGSWRPVGSGSATDGGVSATPDEESLDPCIAVDGLGRISVAWGESMKVQNSVYRQICLRRWDGVSWKELAGSATIDPFTGVGGVSQTSYMWKRATQPSLALDPQGNPVVAWRQVSSDSRQGEKVMLRRWNGVDGWVALGGSFDPKLGLSGVEAADAQHPEVAIDSRGNPAVVWTLGYKIHLAAWSVDPVSGSGSWRPLGPSTQITPAGTNSHPVIVLDAAGFPVVAYENGTSGGGLVQVLRWTGADWLPLRKSAMDEVAAGRRPSLALDLQDRPVVAYVTYGAPLVHLKSWNGTEWVERDGSATLGGIGGPINGRGSNSETWAEVALALDSSGDPYVAWSGPPGEIYLRRWCNRPPSLGPARQLRIDGATPVPPGGTLVLLDDGNAHFMVEAAVQDPNAHLVGLELQVAETGGDWPAETFSGPLLESGATPSVVGTLDRGGEFTKPFRWRVRAVDERGLGTAWRCFAGAADDPARVDIIVRGDTAPVGGLAAQVNAATFKPIPRGGRLVEQAEVVFRADIVDAESDRVAMQVRITPIVGGGGAGVLLSSGWLPSGSTAAVSHVFVTGEYRWEYRVEDEHGARGDWARFAPGSSTETPDFGILMYGGSLGDGPSPCGNAAAGGLSAAAAILVLAASFSPRR